MVYVDNAKQFFGRMIMCHMIADTPEELKNMALAIGVQLKWFQNKASMPHFDIAQSKKKLALSLGAKELNRRNFVTKMKELKPIWPRENSLWLL